MPEIVVHHFFSEKVYMQLPREISGSVVKDLYRIGARGPDPLGIIRFWCLPVWKREHRKSSVMHNEKSGAFFRRLAEEAKAAEKDRDLLFSWCAGLITHYCLDSISHPYIICRTGLGKAYAGNHRSLEHALDREALEKNGLCLKDRPITRVILPCSGLPKEIREAVSRIFSDVFGWKDMWKKINTALRDERRFLRLCEDPNGSLLKMMTRLSAGMSLRSVSYAEAAYTGADTANTRKDTWFNPYDPAVTSSLSMAEMEETALEQAVAMIEGLYEYIYLDREYPGNIGSRSYESGFDTDDPRNRNIPVFSVLQR